MSVQYKGYFGPLVDLAASFQNMSGYVPSRHNDVLSPPVNL